MFEPDPLDRERIERGLRLRRDAHREALHINAMERDRLRHELQELDDAIVGFDHLEMEQLRAWARRLDEKAARKQRQQDAALDATFPASDTPSHLAPGSQVKTH